MGGDAQEPPRTESYKPIIVQEGEGYYDAVLRTEPDLTPQAAYEIAHNIKRCMGNRDVLRIGEPLVTECANKQLVKKGFPDAADLLPEANLTGQALEHVRSVNEIVNAMKAGNLKRVEEIVTRYKGKPNEMDDVGFKLGSAMSHGELSEKYDLVYGKGSDLQGYLKVVRLPEPTSQDKNNVQEIVRAINADDFARVQKVVDQYKNNPLAFEYIGRMVNLGLRANKKYEASWGGAYDRDGNREAASLDLYKSGKKLHGFWTRRVE